MTASGRISRRRLFAQRVQINVAQSLPEWPEVPHRAGTHFRACAAGLGDALGTKKVVQNYLLQNDGRLGKVHYRTWMPASEVATELLHVPDSGPAFHRVLVCLQRDAFALPSLRSIVSNG